MAKGIQGRRGRPSKPYVTSWNEPITGLRRESDGRWRILVTRETFSEPDERFAIQKFRAWEDRQADHTITMPFEEFSDLRQVIKAWENPATDVTVNEADHTYPKLEVSLNTPAAPVWRWMRKVLLERPQWVAEMTGIPQLASLADLPMPKPSIKLESILETYKTHSHCTPHTIRQASNLFRSFMDFTAAETLADLTTDVLMKYRLYAAAKFGPGTIAWQNGQVKSIIGFAKSEGMDASQIDAALSRLGVLKNPKDNRISDPSPVSRNDFHALLAAAQSQWPQWYPRLLLMMNLCLHFDEALDVEWKDLNLEKQTFCTKRNKRGRVIRAATLWPETIAALNSIARSNSPYVFVSRTGSRYVATGQWKTWNKLRTAAKCPTVQLDDLRDGSYSAACNAIGIDEKFARLMAGHGSHGFQDRYVQRNPAIVKPACEAVHRAYFG